MDTTKPNTEVVCKNCGRTFNVGARYWKRFCSSLCQKTWHKDEQQRAREMYRTYMEEHGGKA